jgi:hypothetical protein
MVWLLLAVYQLKHFVADYPLQTPYMLKKFLPGNDFIKPLSAHAGVHALFTLYCLLWIELRHRPKCLENTSLCRPVSLKL